MMKINIEHCLIQASRCLKANDPSAISYTIKEFIENLKEIKKRHEEGKSKEILDQFFNIYVFNKSE